MTLSLSPRDLFVISWLVLPVALYAIVALTRRPRFRALAQILGAAHVDNGLWRPGSIAGDGFTIEISTRWSGSGSSTYHTRVRVTAPGTPGRLFIKPGFFKAFPNWKFVKAIEPRLERAFVMKVTVMRFVELSREQREHFLQWLPTALDPAQVHAALTRARVRDIIVEDGSLMTSVSGCVSNFARIKRIVDALKQFAH